ncbi:hypothetical protein FGO68_gene5494 [Halteria grandinella]|uniref:Acyl-coenzyme A oxidase n=1 Tax=Halteria grandinella TaxID=5974 RepID=A0A8J8NVF7_HALGN|nr:hypothetical protein FGO68_gene5494 [Halteria grandinella]
MQEIFAKDPEFEPAIFVEQTREQARPHATMLLRKLHSEILRRGIFTPQQVIDEHEKYLMCQNTPRGHVALIIKQTLHFAMFLKAIVNLGANDYHKRLMQEAARMDFIGCFAMTELSHGSNVMELRTTATFDEKTKEFVINTPTDNDIKVWIGNLAKDARYALLWARLITQGKDHGVHPFVIQIRDSIYHKPLPGLLIGDMGMKVGYQNMDNGFLRFNNFRVPRDTLLSKFFQVLDDGTYKTEITSKTKRLGFFLQTLSYSRILLGLGAANGNLYANIIALRFAHMRKQFGVPGEPERPLASYQLHQYRLLPKFCQAFVIRFSVDEILQYYITMKPQVVDPTKTLDFLHAICTFTKVYASTCAHNTYLEARQSLGGFGYSYYSEMYQMITYNDVNLTWEGDNKVLLQQTARYIMKNCNRILTGKDVTDQQVKYLKDIHTDKAKFVAKIGDLDFGEEDLKLEDILEIYRVFAANCGFKAMKHFTKGLEEGQDMFDVYLNSVPVILNTMAIAFGEVYYIEAYLRRIAHCKDAPTKRVFEKMGLLYALWNMTERAGDFRNENLISSDQLSQAKDRVLSLLKELIHEAIPLTQLPPWEWYNPFAHEDFYERFLGQVVRADGAFERSRIWKEMLAPEGEPQKK